MCTGRGGPGENCVVLLHGAARDSHQFPGVLDRVPTDLELPARLGCPAAGRTCAHRRPCGYHSVEKVHHMGQYAQDVLGVGEHHAKLCGHPTDVCHHRTARTSWPVRNAVG